MNVTYLTTFYSSELEGRFGRFHDWAHWLRDAETPPFDASVVALSATGTDDILANCPRYDGDQLWGTPYNTALFALDAPSVLQSCRETDPDVLHVVNPEPVSLAIAARVDAPAVLGPDVQGYFHSREGWDYGPKTALKYRLKRRLAQHHRDSQFIALSEYHARNIESLGIDQENVAVIYPGVDPAFAPQATDGGCERDKTQFLFVGDLTNYKGYPLFLRALSCLDGDWRAVVVGRGKRRAGLLYRRGIRDRVRHRGVLPRDELPAIYDAADVFVMPSVDEHGPNTIVEALATGTPVVATDREGINEYADDGAIYAERSVDAFADAMAEARDRLPELTTAARDHAKGYTAMAPAYSLSEVYIRATA